MERVTIIAEAGVNHNGSIDLAKKMIDKAKEAGADYVKFQTSKWGMVASRYAQMADYQKANTQKDESQNEMFKSFFLDWDDFVVLKRYCDNVGIKFLSTPFDIFSIEFLCELGVDFIKVPSGEITNLPYLRKVAKTKLPVVMSTGMSTLGEIESAIKILIDNGKKRDDITILHCNTEYPTPYGDVNLRAMLTIKDAFGVKIGYSDHTKGIEVPIAAVAMGASVIEKHFTLDCNMNGPDHKASLEPDELNEMVRCIRNVEKALGCSIKAVSDSERKNINVARKSIVAFKSIKKGEVFTEKNIISKRPGNGISPMKWDEVIGTVAKRDFYEDELIEL